MAERGGRRVSFFSPAKVSIESRGRLTICAPGNSFSHHRPHGGGAEHHGLLARRGR